MKIKKNIYKQPLTQLVKLKTTEPITDTTYPVNTSKGDEVEEGWAKKHDFEPDDFNFEEGGVGEWSSDWSSEWKSDEE